MKKHFFILVLIFVSVFFVCCNMGNDPEPQKIITEEIEVQENPPKIIPKDKLYEQAKADAKSVVIQTAAFLKKVTVTTTDMGEQVLMDSKEVRTLLKSYSNLASKYSQNPDVWKLVRSCIRNMTLDYYPDILGKDTENPEKSLKRILDPLDCKVTQILSLGKIAELGVLYLFTKDVGTVVGAIDVSSDYYLDLIYKFLVGLLVNKDYCNDDKSFSDLIKLLDKEKITVKKSEAATVPLIVTALGGNEYEFKYPDYYKWNNDIPAPGPAVSNPIPFSVSIEKRNVVLDPGIPVVFDSKNNVNLECISGSYRYEVRVSDVAEKNYTVSVKLNSKEVTDRYLGAYCFTIHDPDTYILTVTVTPTGAGTIYTPKTVAYSFTIEDPMEAFTEKLIADAPGLLISVIGSMLTERSTKTVLFYKDVDPEFYNTLKTVYSASDDDKVYSFLDLLDPLYINDAVNLIDENISKLSTLHPSVDSSSIFQKMLGKVKISKGLSIDEFADSLLEGGAFRKFNKALFPNENSGSYPVITNDLVSNISNTEEPLMSSEKETIVKVFNIFHCKDDIFGLLANSQIIDDAKLLVGYLASAPLYEENLSPVKNDQIEYQISDEGIMNEISAIIGIFKDKLEIELDPAYFNINSYYTETINSLADAVERIYRINIRSFL